MFAGGGLRDCESRVSIRGASRNHSGAGAWITSRRNLSLQVRTEIVGVQRAVEFLPRLAATPGRGNEACGGLASSSQATGAFLTKLLDDDSEGLNP